MIKGFLNSKDASDVKSSAGIVHVDVDGNKSKVTDSSRKFTSFCI